MAMDRGRTVPARPSLPAAVRLAARHGLNEVRMLRRSERLLTAERDEGGLYQRWQHMVETCRSRTAGV